MFMSLALAALVAVFSFALYKKYMGNKTNSDSVTELTDESFETFIQKSKEPVFVKFYDPNCGFCKRLKPTWDELQKHVKGVKIAQLNCIENVQTCVSQQIEGYPTLRGYFNHSDTNTFKAFRGERSMEGLKGFSRELASMNSSSKQKH